MLLRVSTRVRKILGAAILITLLAALRYWLQAFSIPQNGMFPTCPAHATFIAARYLLSPDPQRGDVVVYSESRPGGEVNFVWRVIGLPGDKIEIRDNIVRVNGVSITGPPETTRGGFNIYPETSGEQAYTIAVPTKPKDDAAANMSEVAVLPGRVFLMGDNRHNAYDSRATGGVPIASLQSRLLWVLPHSP